MLIVPHAMRDAHAEQERRLAEGFSSLRVGSDFSPRAERYVFLCFTNRCGSDLLSQALASSGRLPEFEEPFNIDVTRERASGHGISSFGDYFDFTSQLLGLDGWFCAKLAVGQLAFLIHAGVLDAIRARTRFILLERNDRVGQAISRRIAWQNRRWTSLQRSIVADDALVYDRQALDRDMAAVERDNGCFRLFFRANDILPVHLSYESVVGDVAGVVAFVGEALGLGALRADAARIKVARVSGSVNEVWRRRYLAGN